MAKTKISEFSSTPGNNTDIDSINIAEGCAPSGINDAIRELMAQLKDFQQGTAGDSFNGPVGTSTAAAGAFTTLSASGAVTLSGGTANGVPYLNGSKVLTSGSALTFDGTRLGVGGTAVELLDVFGTGQFRADLKVNGTFSLQRSSGSLYLPVAAYTNGSGSILSGGTKGDIVAFGNVGGDGIIFANANAEAMRLTSTGLGIGTSSPLQKLDVRGRAGVYGASDVYQLKLSYDVGTAGFWLGSPSANALAFYNDAGTERMRLDSSGNLGLGVTPSAGDSYYRKLELGKPGCGIAAATTALTSSELTYFTGNAVVTYTGGNPWVYGNAGGAGIYGIEDGIHKWSIAGSGTAGNAISFTQAMTLDASGNLLVGTTSASEKLTVLTGTTYAAAFNTTNTASATTRISIGGFTTGSGGSGGAVAIGSEHNHGGTAQSSLTLYTHNGSSLGERARIDSSGNLLVGATSAAASERLRVEGTVASFLARYYNNSGSAYGVGIIYPTSAPNGTSNEFLYCQDSAAIRMTVRSNGGIANFSGNNVNLSDRREKTNFAPAKSYLETICAIPVQTFNYIDQNMEEDPGTTLGVVAQDVQAVAPELVMESNWGTEDESKVRLSIYQTDLQYALMKALQELKAEFDAYKASHP